MVLKGLPDEYKAFVAVTTQAENVDDFKTSLKHFEETENSHTQSSKDQSSSIRKLVDTHGNLITCYTCGDSSRHKCDKKKNQCCNICKNKSYNPNKCRKKNRDNVNKTRDDGYHFAFKINDEYVKIKKSAHTFLVDCGATTHIVNDRFFVSLTLIQPSNPVTITLNWLMEQPSMGSPKKRNQ